jgi:hypothetical protein
MIVNQQHEQTGSRIKDVSKVGFSVILAALVFNFVIAGPPTWIVSSLPRFPWMKD